MKCLRALQGSGVADEERKCGRPCGLFGGLEQFGNKPGERILVESSHVTWSCEFYTMPLILTISL